MLAVVLICSSCWECSLQQAAPTLSSPCFPKYFPPAHRNAAIEYADVLLLFSAGKIYFFSQTHQFSRGKASKTDIRTVLQWRVTICLPFSSSSSQEGRKKFRRGLALHYLLALTFIPCRNFLATQAGWTPTKIGKEMTFNSFSKAGSISSRQCLSCIKPGRIWFCFSLKNRKGK